jgi:hypothetical protein
MNREQVIADTHAAWRRFVAALRGEPLIINTEPPYYPPNRDRRDRLDHAWTNLYTEGVRRLLRRPAGDELSQRLGQALSIIVPLGAVAAVTGAAFGGVL